jgi:PTH1 family peptidyl-tRNA hydrolase
VPARAVPRLLVGLGNPGREYARTRHNLGFMVVDEIARRWNVEKWKTKDSARQAFVPEHRALLVEPTSYMNLSGAPVRLIASWYKTPPAEIFVIVDDLDLPFGKLRARPFGGHGGHNGLRSIIATVGEEFPRLRVGVGRRDDQDAVDRVLAPFDAHERDALAAIVGAAADTALIWLDEGIDAAMRFANTWQPGAVQS